MRALNVEELKKVNGGAAHYHWTCSPCKYVSVARTFTSCNKYRKAHDQKHHSGNTTATYYLCYSTTGNCSKIYQN